jgi:demethylmenaquinone methyltransferase/2-methoxy-6-polyprenyl-1,4-benzoquinol methylase
MTLDKTANKIGKMFDDISGSYDFLNHFFTLGLDLHWRRKIRKYVIKNKILKNHLLDLASGTGDLTVQFLKLKPDILFSCDISEKMLSIQRKKINDEKLNIINASAEKLPFENEYFDVTGIAFGIRNFDNIEMSLKEINRTMKKGGYLIILDMFNNKSAVTKFFDVYFSRIIPALGNLISRSKHRAYNYLYNSVKTFYTKEEFIDLLEKHNFKLVKVKTNFLNFVHTFYFRRM